MANSSDHRISAPSAWAGFWQAALLLASLAVAIAILAGGDSPAESLRIAQGGLAPYWWNDRVFYEVFIRSFQDSDGDGIGDIEGLIERLDYLNDGDPQTSDDLGIGGIWLMPPAEAHSYHGYDVTDYYAVESDYGELADMRRLVAEAHKRGIAVIVDMVLNHSSSRHPWFLSSRLGEQAYADWYIWRDEDPGYRGPWGAPAWHRAGDRYYYGVFWDGMPDLNYNNPAVTREIYDIATFWLDEVGVDGFRWMLSSTSSKWASARKIRRKAALGSAGTKRIWSRSSPTASPSARSLTGRLSSSPATLKSAL